MITEKEYFDKIEIVNNNFIHVRKVTIIEKDGVEIARTNHRYTFVKGDDLSEMPENVRDIAKVIWLEK